MNKAINLKAKLQTFSELWSPKIIAKLNNYHLKLAKIEGEFVWHKHDETDEMFLVISGNMSIDFKNESVDLQPGEVFIVPRGVEHRPRANSECCILLIEPAGTINTGDTESNMTTLEEQWI